ncbi:MAG: DNA-binding protein [Nitrospirae bacterium]|nr:MAG: DNA-binding protein [Nitrospirota bacterium]
MNKAFPLLMAVLAIVTFLGCTSEKYGAAVDTRIAAVKVKDILLDSNPAGRKVALEGKISSQCGSNGCWFVLQDDTGQIFVNLGPKNLTLPPRMNKTAKVSGTVFPVRGELQVFAEGIEVR